MDRDVQRPLVEALEYPRPGDELAALGCTLDLDAPIRPDCRAQPGLLEDLVEQADNRLLPGGAGNHNPGSVSVGGDRGPPCRERRGCGPMRRPVALDRTAQL